jgi:hypothetical protein
MRFPRVLVAMIALAGVAYLFECGLNIRADARDGGTTRIDAFDIEYSHWSAGGCSTSRIADVLCWMGLEARLASGELLGRVLFGQEETSRFLTIETLRSTDRMSLLFKIDGILILGRPVVCPAEGKFCEAVLSVDNKLLSRLMNGSALTIEVQGVTRLHFPLRDFAHARRTLL